MNTNNDQTTKDRPSLDPLGSGTPDKSGASDEESARSGAGGVLRIGEWVMPSKTFTHSEWEEMTKDDPVLNFIKRVNAAAVAKPYWSEDFRRAQYDAMAEEHGKYACAAYNGGEAFCISDGAERRGENGESQSRAGSTTE